MNRLFRQRTAGLTGYAALTLFGIAYLAAMALVLAPGTFQTDQTTMTTQSASGP